MQSKCSQNATKIQHHSGLRKHMSFFAEYCTKIKKFNSPYSKAIFFIFRNINCLKVTHVSYFKGASKYCTSFRFYHRRKNGSSLRPRWFSNISQWNVATLLCIVPIQNSIFYVHLSLVLTLIVCEKWLINMSEIELVLFLVASVEISQRVHLLRSIKVRILGLFYGWCGILQTFQLCSS